LDELAITPAQPRHLGGQCWISCSRSAL
jgi:hypothetical protein